MFYELYHNLTILIINGFGKYALTHFNYISLSLLNVGWIMTIFRYNSVEKMLNTLTSSKFHNSSSNLRKTSIDSINGVQTNVELLRMIIEYEQQQQSKDELQQDKKEGVEFEINSISEVFADDYMKSNIKPVRMFKDRMELEKENAQKKLIVRQLENLNKKLKLEYDVSLNNNHKMEMFLKEIQFIFKNDRSNQKANETLLKATKTLHRQKQQSKNYIEKLIKITKTNEMRELKTYLKVLQNEKNRLSMMLVQEIAKNQKLRKAQDFNESQIKKFQYYQNLSTQILSTGLKDVIRVRESYKKQKSTIKIALSGKQVEYIRREIQNIDTQVAEQLLKKQGLEYEIEILKNKNKQRNKKNIKEQGSILKFEINKIRKKILILQQDLKQKIKTHEYIVRWTKQLKAQLEQLKENHINVKEQYEDEINKLSKQIEEWNRKYKAELIEEQNISKKGVIRVNQVGRQSAGIDRKIRVVKVYEIEHLQKKIIFYLLENDIDALQFVRDSILGNNKTISLKQLHKNLCNIPFFQEEQQSQIYKLARYIVEDNNCNYTKINPNQTIETSIAILIFKNLLTFQVKSSNIQEIRAELKQFLNKNFDEVRHDIWVNSVNLRNALSKYINSEHTITKYVQYVEYLIWKKFCEGRCFKISSFQKICEMLLGRKLVKDNQSRTSKATIRSIFDRVYMNKNEICAE